MRVLRVIEAKALTRPSATLSRWERDLSDLGILLGWV
jgi:hypothetical protein